MVKQPLLYLVLAGLLCCHYVLAAETRWEVITLQHRTVADIIPIIQPLLDGQGKISGLGRQLIVQATPAKLTQIKAILAKIDLPRLRLLVTVRYSSRHSGPSAQTSAQTSTQTRTISTRPPDTNQQLQVLEGQWAIFKAGATTPVIEPAMRYSSDHTTLQLITRQRNTGVSFRVLPRVSQTQVTLTIESLQERLATQKPGTVDRLGVHTTIRGQLGQWIDVGNTWPERGRDAHTKTYTTADKRDITRRILVKVEVLED